MHLLFFITSHPCSDILPGKHCRFSFRNGSCEAAGDPVWDRPEPYELAVYTAKGAVTYSRLTLGSSKMYILRLYNHSSVRRRTPPISDHVAHSSHSFSVSYEDQGSH